MKKHETIAEYEFRLKQLAKNSKDTSTHFRYLSKNENRIVTLKN